VNPRGERGNSAVKEVVVAKNAVKKKDEH